MGVYIVHCLANIPLGREIGSSYLASCLVDLVYSSSRATTPWPLAVGDYQLISLALLGSLNRQLTCEDNTVPPT